MKTKRQFKMKDGTVVPAGAEIKPNPASHSKGLVLWNGKSYRVGWEKLAKVPSMATLQRWSDDGIAKSVNGKKTEPDGIDGEGFPSWFQALGII